jgi:hypothetical protein
MFLAHFSKYAGMEDTAGSRQSRRDIAQYQAVSQTGRQANKQTDRQTDRQTNRQTAVAQRFFRAPRRVAINSVAAPRKDGRRLETVLQCSNNGDQQLGFRAH